MIRYLENILQINSNEIVIGAIQGSSLISKCIQLFQDGYPYTHVFYVKDFHVSKNVSDNKVVITVNKIEAQEYPIYKGGEVRMYYHKFLIHRLSDIQVTPITNNDIHLNNLYKGNIYTSSLNKDIISFFWLKCDRNKKISIENFLYSQLSKKYDFLGIVDFIIPYVDDLQDKNKWFCSEILSFACKNTNYNIWKNIKPYHLTVKKFIKPVIRYSHKKISFKPLKDIKS